MIKLGLVTVLYNGVDVLEGFFRSLGAQTYTEWHLEVIDNSPGVESIDLAKALAVQYGVKSVNFVRNPDNFGVAKGNNQGIQNCLERGTDYVVLLNNDIEFDANLLGALVAEINLDRYDILVPKIHYYDSGKLWYAGGRINEFSGTVNHFGEGESDQPRYSGDCFTGYAPTCFMAIKADVFRVVGLMDERYFVYYDDTDFVLRCARAGFKLRYLGRLALQHKVSSSTGGGSSKFSIYYYNRNRLFFIRKNGRGLVYFIAMAWYFATRLYKYCIYDSENRTVLLKAMNDGLQLR